LTYTIAAVAVETGISPQDLLDAPEGILEAITIYMKERAKSNG
jgi:hypothetical protein